jgi:ATP-dependent Clp protease ATP-binding subunit ClpA
MSLWFELFTEGARQVVVKAQREAREQGHDYIGTEHILIGLLREEDGLGALVLNSLGVQLENTRPKVLDIVPPGNNQISKPLPLTPHANKTCDLALRESLSLGHHHVGTEHELLGLIRDSQPSDYPREETGMRNGTPEGKLFPDDEKSIVGEVLTSLNVELDEVRNSTMRWLNGKR